MAFILDGVKKNKLERMVQNYNLKNVIFLPYQPKSELPFSLTAPSVSIVTYENYLEGLLMPSKLYTTLAAGVPVVGLCYKNSEVARIIKEAECGFIVEGNDVNQFYDIIMGFKDDFESLKSLGLNSRKYFEENFTLDIAVKKYFDIINLNLR